MNRSDYLVKVRNTIVITYSGRSGSYLLSNILDGHPSLVCTPPHSLIDADAIIYKSLVGSVSELKDGKLTTLWISNYIDKILNEFPLLIKPNLQNMHLHEFHLGSLVQKTNFGVEDSNKLASMAKKFFVDLLNQNLDSRGNRNFNLGDFIGFTIVAISLGYHAARFGDVPERVSVVLQRHNPFFNSLKYIKSYFYRPIFLKTIRNPVKAIDSHAFHHSVEHPISNPIEHVLGVFAASMYSDDRSFAIKFEDMHLKSANLRNSLCRLLELDYDISLENLTIDGQPAFFPKRSTNNPDASISGLRSNLESEKFLNFFSRKEADFMSLLMAPLLDYYQYEYLDWQEAGDNIFYPHSTSSNGPKPTQHATNNVLSFSHLLKSEKAETVITKILKLRPPFLPELVYC